MAFCNRCGAQLEEGSRFCVKCGADQTKKTDGAPAARAAAPPVAAPQASAPPPPYAMPPAAPGQMPFVATGQVPMSAAIPQQPATKKSGMMWLAILVVVVGGYYYYKQNQPSQNPGQTTPSQTQPGQPAPQAAPQPAGYPQQPGYPQTQPNNPQQPGDQPGGQGGGNQALVQQQQLLSWQANAVNGSVQISQLQWRNGANVTIQSATFECIQYGQTGQAITQMQTTLNGPAQPGQTISFPTFQMGAMAQGVTKVNCGIVAVNPAS